MKLKPGSAPWLLAHDLRLARRQWRASGKTKRIVLRVVFIGIVLWLHINGMLYAPELARMHDTDRPAVLLAFSFGLAGAFALFLSKAVSEATDALYQRGDLDLLLSSPIPMRRVLITRIVAIAVNAGVAPMLLTLPLVNGMMLRGRFAWVGLYPALIGLALLAASTGAATTFGLLRLVGPRWTKIAARAVATVLGAVTFVAIQARVLLSDATRSAIWRALEPDAAPSGVQWWPARAALGDWEPTLAITGLAIAAVALVSGALGQAYGTGVMSTLALPRGNGSARLARFRDNTGRALLRKEWLLLLRHPGLGAQVFYQAVFLIPGTIAMMNIGGTGQRSPAGVVFLTAMMTGRISKIVLAGPFEGDQAAGLAATAPIATAVVMRAKVAIASGALAVIAGLPVLAIGLRFPDAFPALCLACGAAAGTRMAIAINRPSQWWRPGLQGRLQASTDGLLGVVIDVGWGIAGALLTFFV